MNAILLVLTLLVADTLSFNKTWTSGAIGNEAVSDSKGVRKSVGVRNYKFAPFFCLAIAGMWLATGIGFGLYGTLSGKGAN
ncbi:hypothetical protein RB195_017919 [Necator americanus]|uniref:Uncharacterized protein n=1 Tax=Necator americanus TaxID=51031 RepID=A0ABR1C7C2_NECAM